MAEYRIRYAQQAADDLDAIFDFICLDDPEQARKMLQAFKISISRLASAPFWVLHCGRILRCLFPPGIAISSFRPIGCFIALWWMKSGSIAFSTADRIVFRCSSDSAAPQIPAFRLQGGGFLHFGVVFTRTYILALELFRKLW